jgi:hypothetical protein
VRTVATAALLLAGAGLSDSEVGAVTRYVFGRGRDFAARGSAQIRNPKLEIRIEFV